MSYIVQSVLLKRDKFSKVEALQWIRSHGYSAGKIDVTPEYYRFRQVAPDILHLLRPNTIPLGDVGHLVVGYTGPEV